MGCEICNRSSCTRSFHTLDEQQEFDNVADGIKDRIKKQIENKVNKLDYDEIRGYVYVRLSDVISAIDDAD